LASEEQRIAIGALLEAHQMATAELALPFYSDVVGRPVASTKTLTVVEADAVLAALRATLPPGLEAES
jgi:hypothetical protein